MTTSTPAQPHDEILPVTALRFVAALYVFLFHIHIRWPLGEAGSAIHQFFSLGAVGMSLFFILSGFVLAYTYSRPGFEIKSYAVGRFTRIYPVYFAAAVVTLPFLFLTVEATGLPFAAKLALYGFLIFTNIFLIQAWFPTTFYHWNNGGSWSISVEAFFYAALPLALFLMRNRSARTLVACLAVFYVASTLPGVAFLAFPNPPPLPTYYAGPVFRIPEFLVGVSVGLLYARGFRLPKPAVSFLLTVAVLGLYLLFGNPAGFAYITLNFVAVPLLTMIILSAASITDGACYRVLTWKPFVSMGRASYSFYAFQAFLISGLIIAHPAIAERIPVTSNGWVVAGASFTILTAISLVSRSLIEVKFRKFLDQRVALQFDKRAVDRTAAGDRPTVAS